MSKTNKTMVSALMMPLYHNCKHHSSYESWWGSVFGSYLADKDDPANCVISRYMTGDRTLKPEYIRHYADGDRSPKQLVDDLKECIEVKYQGYVAQRELYDLLLAYARNDTDPLDREILIPGVIHVSPSIEEIAKLWAKLLLYAMSMDMCRDLFRS